MPQRGQAVCSIALCQRHAFAAVVVMCSASFAAAQWSVARLGVSDSTSSFLTGVSGSQQVGYTLGNDGPLASLWSGTAASRSSMNPSTATSSVIYATASGQHVGYAVIGGQSRAGRWGATAASWVSLHPAGAQSSIARAVANGKQAGSVTRSDGLTRAAIWTGSANSWTDLTPSTAIDAGVFGIDMTRQVGYVQGFNGRAEASLWQGSAASWISLHPWWSGMTASAAVAVHNGQQVGSTYTGQSQDVERAALWTGTAESWVNLHPQGASHSGSTGVFNGLQVGYAAIGPLTRVVAAIWNGTPESFQPLPYPTSDWSGTTQATAIWGDSTTLYVSGYGLNARTGFYEALLWTRPVPAPTTAAIAGLGAIFAGRRRRNGALPGVDKRVPVPNLRESARR